MSSGLAQLPASVQYLVMFSIFLLPLTHFTHPSGARRNSQASAQPPMNSPPNHHGACKASICSLSNAPTVRPSANPEIPPARATQNGDEGAGKASVTRMAEDSEPSERVSRHYSAPMNTSPPQAPQSPLPPNNTETTSGFVLVQQREADGGGDKDVTEGQHAGSGLFRKILGLLSRMAIPNPTRRASQRGSSTHSRGNCPNDPIRGEAEDQSSSMAASFSSGDSSLISCENLEVTPPQELTPPTPPFSGCTISAPDQELSESFRELDALCARMLGPRRSAASPLQLPEVQGVERSAGVPIPRCIISGSIRSETGYDGEYDSNAVRYYVTAKTTVYPSSFQGYHHGHELHRRRKQKRKRESSILSPEIRRYAFWYCSEAQLLASGSVLGLLEVARAGLIKRRGVTEQREGLSVQLHEDYISLKDPEKE
ncbi:hypothetical protein C7212DRAFT_365759 [Tuber magnatum]|uniref:Uncharacterized protein n=1 Tax=Tuber magnatum TaxID=42249 RepID=A0A317SJK6_9PEZI|nr:hypothetical protein C7212DRAFT_365759 [Tuber magnatum]